MIVDAFEKKNPNIKVNLTVYPWQQIDQQLTQAVKAGQSPDLSRGQFELLSQHVAAGDILPLDKYVANWTSQQKNGFLAPWETTVFNGHKMSFYIENRCYPLMYRKDLIKQPPVSWDDLGKVAAEQTTPPKYGIVIPLSQKGQASGLIEYLFPTIWGAGGDFFTSDGKAAFASDAGNKAFQLLADLIHKYKGMPASATSADIEAVTQSMMAGTQTMAIIGTHRITFMWTGKATTKENLGVTYIPSFEAGKPSPTFSDGWQIMLAHGSKNPDAAWTFIDHILSPASQLTNIKVGGEIPVLRSVLDDPWFKTADAADFAFAVKYLGESKKRAAFPTTWNQLANDLAAGAQQVVSGGQTPADALSAIAKKFDATEKSG